MKKIVPHKILLIGWLLWLFFFLISPYSYYKIAPLFPAVALLAAYNIALFAGLYITRKRLQSIETIELNVETNKMKRLFFIVFILGLIGNVLNVSLKLASLDVFSITNGEENRVAIIELGEFSGNPLSVAAAICYPFSIVACILAVYFKELINKTAYYGAMVSGAFPGLFLLSLGARSTLFFFILLITFTYLIKRILSGVPGKIMTFKRAFQFFMAGIAILFLFVFVQSNRIQVLGIDEQNLFKYRSDQQEWHYLYDAPISYFFGDKPYQHSGFLDFIHYYVHGVFEFIRLYNFSQSSMGELFGRYEGYVFLKFFKVFGVDIGETSTALNMKYFYKPGVYTSFWGPYYIDFGLVGILLAFLIGKYVRTVFFKLRSGKLPGLLLYPFILSVIFSIPVTNSVIGQNTYLLVSLAITIVIYRHVL